MPTTLRQRNKPRTVHDYKRLLGKHFRFGKIHLTEITQQEVMRRIHRLKNTPTEQNHAFVAARAFFRWAARNRYIERSPLEGLSPPAVTKSRDRVLSPSELGEVYQAALAHPYPYGSIVALLILTGQRKGEIAALQWEWIDQFEQTITFPASATKNKRQHTFPYGQATAHLIKQLPEINEYLFPASRTHVRGKPTTIFNGWPKSKLQFDATLTAVEPYTLHDVRRTFSSTHAALGTPIHVTEKLLNHVSGTLSGIAAIYNRHTYMDEMRGAMASYENHLANLISS